MAGALRRWSVVVMIVGLALGILAGPAAAATPRWHFETLDGAGGPDGRVDGYVGGFGKTALVYSGQPHVWYYAPLPGDLRHAWWTGTKWQFETLDGDSTRNGRMSTSTGTYSAALLYGGQPHVWYTETPNGYLRHAWWTGSTWRYETLDGAGGPNGRTTDDVGGDMAVTLYGGRPHVWYFDATSHDLRHGWWDGTTWRFETLDGAGGPNGRVLSELGSLAAATLYGGLPHVWYDDQGSNLDVPDGNLRHAWWDGTTWRFETLDGAGGPRGRVAGDVGYGISATLYGGQPHVWYRRNGSTNDELRHAWWNGATWQFEALDGAGGPNGRVVGGIGDDNDVTLYEGQPHVWYLSTSTGEMRHAWWDGDTWRFETLVGAKSAGGHIGYGIVATLYDGRPHVWYYEEQGTRGLLRHAWWG